MVDTQPKKITTLEAFVKQREKRQNDTGIQAQKLVNLYRHLPLFGEDFLEKYNQMLLAAPADVQLALSDITAGSIVRQYLEFLKSKQQPNTDKVDEEIDKPVDFSYQQQSSYLPSPDDIPAYHFDAPESGSVVVSNGDPVATESLLKAQASFFEEALTKQTQFLEQTLLKMQEGVVEGLSQLKENMAQSFVDGNTLQAQSRQEVLNNTLSEVLERQNALFCESLAEVLETTKEATQRQTAVLEKVLERGIQHSADPYEVIEEEAPVITSAESHTAASKGQAETVAEPPHTYDMNALLDEMTPVYEEGHENPEIILEDMSTEKIPVQMSKNENVVSKPSPKISETPAVQQPVTPSKPVTAKPQPPVADPLEEGVEMLSEIDLPSDPL